MRQKSQCGLPLIPLDVPPSVERHGIMGWILKAHYPHMFRKWTDISIRDPITEDNDVFNMTTWEKLHVVILILKSKQNDIRSFRY